MTSATTGKGVSEKCGKGGKMSEKSTKSCETGSKWSKNSGITWNYALKSLLKSHQLLVITFERNARNLTNTQHVVNFQDSCNKSWVDIECQMTSDIRYHFLINIRTFSYGYLKYATSKSHKMT